jgi:Sporulation and spore germination
VSGCGGARRAISGESRRKHARRPQASGALAAALLLALSCHGSAQTPSPQGGDAPPDPAAVAGRVKVVLIAPRDGGRLGRKVACDDSAVPVEVELPRPEPAFAGAVRALLAMGERYDRGSGLLNQLYASHLELAGVERRGGQATVRLSGYVELGDACDNARLLAQLTETALQFRGISQVQFEIDGQPLAGLLRGGAPSPLPPPSPPSPASPAAPVPPPAPPDDLPPTPPPAAAPGGTGG